MLEPDPTRPKVLVYADTKPLLGRQWWMKCPCCDKIRGFRYARDAIIVGVAHAFSVHPAPPPPPEPEAMTQLIPRVKEKKLRPRILSIRGKRRERFSYEPYMPGTQMSEVESWLR